jgi:hypothetical protein
MSHSGVSGSQAACASPELFAADHALHQRSEPSHPLNGCGARFLLKPGSISGYSQRVHDVTITCVIQSFIWSIEYPIWTRRDLNPRPLACKASAHTN